MKAKLISEELYDEFDQNDEDFNENEHEGKFAKQDGWNKQALEDIGLLEWLQRSRAIQYEIESARRGSYAIDGDSDDDLIMALEELNNNLSEILENMKEM